jgi:hypothetical protein
MAPRHTAVQAGQLLIVFFRALLREKDCQSSEIIFNYGHHMTAVEIFRKFQDAQQAPGEFAYFTLLFFMRDIKGAVQHVNSAFPGEMQLSLLTSMVDRGYPPLGILGVPSFDGLKHGQTPYVERLLEEDWVAGHMHECLKQCVWMIEHNPPRR